MVERNAKIKNVCRPPCVFRGDARQEPKLYRRRERVYERMFTNYNFRTTHHMDNKIRYL